MYQEILVPTDGSPGAEAAVPWALELARTFGGRIHALSVTRPPAESDPVPDDAVTDEAMADVREAAETEAAAATRRVRERANEAGVDVHREVREGRPSRAILEYAAEAGIDLVVMGTHGRTGTGHGRLGSTPERVVTRAEVPVLVIRSPGGVEIRDAEPVSFDRIVVPTDGSDLAERAGEHALGIAERCDADLHVVYVVDATSHDVERLPRSIVGLLKEGGRNAVEGIAADARERAVRVSTRILRGVPETAILQYASGVDADLVAMGTRGQAAPDDRFLGSTTARVVRRSMTPILTVS